jgi:hypothetical protein
MKLDTRQKQIAMIAGAAVLLYLVYRWYSSQSTAATSTGAVAPNTSSGDYASLAGQEQSDVAGLQGQNSQLLSQEQGDVAGLTSSIAGLGAQESSDVSGLTSSIGGFSDQFDQLATSQATLGGEVASLATGVQQLNRAQTAQAIQTHKGGPFYTYYVKVTGKPPPRSVQASNFVYSAWKSGVKASALQTASKPHPSSKNTQVAHPNPAHTQQPHAKPTPPKPPPKPAEKPKPPPPAPKPPPPKPPPKSTKPKASGVRR